MASTFKFEREADGYQLLFKKVSQPTSKQVKINDIIFRELSAEKTEWELVENDVLINQIYHAGLIGWFENHCNKFLTYIEFETDDQYKIVASRIFYQLANSRIMDRLIINEPLTINEFVARLNTI